MDTQQKVYEWDFFISYTGKDQLAAIAIALALLEGHYRVTMQYAHMVAGSVFPKEMQNALQNSERMIVVLSHEYLASGFCESEWMTTFVQDPTGSKRLIIPIRIAPCDLTGSLLSGRVYIDAVGKSYDEMEETVLAEIEAVIRGERNLGSKDQIAAAWDKTQLLSQTPKSPIVIGFDRINNLNYIDRDGKLAQLQEALETSKKVAIVGMFGIGKTLWVTQYVHKSLNTHSYDYILWVNGEDALAFEGGLATIALKLGLIKEDNQHTAKEAAGLVKTWLETHDKWLLVIDNAEQSADIASYLPTIGNGHIIVTSRNNVWNDGLTISLPLDVFTPEEAEAFLQKRTSIEDPEGARDLAAKVGYHPLALEIIGADLEGSGGSFDDYDDSDLEQLWKDAKKPVTYEKIIATVLDASLKRLKPAYVQLLNLFAFFAPKFPMSLIKDGLGQLPKTIQEEIRGFKDLAKAIGTMRKASLLEKDGGNESISIHRAVQLARRTSLSDKETREWVNVGVEIVLYVFRDVLSRARTRATNTLTNAEFWGTNWALADSAISVVSKANQVRIFTEHAWLLAIRFGVWCGEYNAEYQKGEIILRYSCDIAKVLFGSNSERMAHSLDSLGIILTNSGKLQNALDVYLQAIAILERLNPYHEGLVVLYSSCAETCVMAGELEKASKWYERASLALTHLPQSFGRLEAATIYFGLGDISYAKGEYDKAVQQYELSYKRYAECFGNETDARLWFICLSLGKSLIKARHTEQGREFLQKAVMLSEQFGPPTRHQKLLLEVKEVLKSIDE